MKGGSLLLVLLMAMLLLAGGAVFIGPVSDPSWTIIQEIRLPRVLLAIIVGIGLAGAGAVLRPEGGGRMRSKLLELSG